MLKQETLEQVEQEARPAPPPTPRAPQRHKYAALAASAVLALSVWGGLRVQDLHQRLLQEQSKVESLAEDRGDLEHLLAASEQERQALSEQIEGLDRASRERIEELELENTHQGQ